jgi:hypothetical protein
MTFLENANYPYGPISIGSIRIYELNLSLIFFIKH